jgi:hypothetical protein
VVGWSLVAIELEGFHMHRTKKLAAALIAATALLVPAAGSAFAATPADNPAPSTQAGPAKIPGAWVYVARHATPALIIRDSSGQGTTPGNEVGQVGPGGPLWAYCVTQGARLTVWGVTSQSWVAVDFNDEGRYAFGPGLVVPDALPAC